MATSKITRVTVASAEPAIGTYVIWDVGVPGFGLRVYPTGRKSWILSYRPFPGGAKTPKRTALIGRAEDLSPDQARKQADYLRSQIRTGSDPHAAKMDARHGITVAELGQAFMSRRIVPKRGALTAAAYLSILQRLVYPKIGSKRAESLSSREVSALHSEIGEDRVLKSGERLAGHPYQANKVLAVLSSMYGWASGPVGMVAENTNPTRGIERFEEAARGEVLSSEEMGRLGTALRLAETEGVPWRLDPTAKAKHRRKTAESERANIDPYAAAAIRLLIFTGMRLREVLNLRWDEIDFERGLIVLAKHKTSRTTGTKGVVLNEPALRVLRELSRLGQYVIAGAKAGQSDEKPRADLKRPWSMIREAADLPDLTIHGLRHNFGGFGVSDGHGLPIVGKLLGHTQPRTTARYAHFDTDPLKRASEGIGSKLAQAMGDSARSEDADDN